MKPHLIWTQKDCSKLSFYEVKELHFQYLKTKLSHEPRYQSILSSLETELEAERSNQLETSRCDDRRGTVSAIESGRIENHGETVEFQMLSDSSVTDCHTVLEWRLWNEEWRYTGTMGLKIVLETKTRSSDRQLFNYGVNPNAEYLHF